MIIMFRGELWVGLHSGVLLKVTDRQRSLTPTLIAKSQKENKSLNLWWSFEDFQILSKWWPPFCPISATNFPMHPKFARMKLRNISQRWSTSPPDYIFVVDIKLSCKNVTVILSKKTMGISLTILSAQINFGASGLLILKSVTPSNLHFTRLDSSQKCSISSKYWRRLLTLLHVCAWGANNYKEVLKHTRSNWWPIPPDYPPWLWSFPNNLLQ